MKLIYILFEPLQTVVFSIKFQRIQTYQLIFLIYFLDQNTSYFNQGNNDWIASLPKYIIPYYRQIGTYI